MKKMLAIPAIIIAWALSFQPESFAQDDFEKAAVSMDEGFDKSTEELESEWNKVDAATEAEWEELFRRTEAEWEKLRSEVEQKWDEFYYSTNKEWVDYDENKETRSRVDFEAGEIEVTALVPLEQLAGAMVEIKALEPENEILPSPVPPAISDKKPPSPLPLHTRYKTNPSSVELKSEQQKQVIAQAMGKIKQQSAKVFSERNELKTEVLAGQVVDLQGRAVTQKNVGQYLDKQATPKEMIIGDKLVIGQDGKPRIKVSAKIKMVPNHVLVRADKFKAYVKKYAAKYKIAEALIFGIIHTESYFNPVAKSWVPAYGLMQLVPRFAALEAYHYLYGAKKLLPEDFLFEPENNVMLGSTYFYLLYNKYFANITTHHRNLLCIAAYNCGPTTVSKLLAKSRGANNMDGQELWQFLQSGLPAETRDYLSKVLERMNLYVNTPI